MPEPKPQQLVRLLASQELRIRTGILELPIKLLGTEANLAVELGVGYQNICDWKANRIPPDQSHLGLSCEVIISDLAEALLDKTLPGYCVWVSGIDALLASIPFDDRMRFWDFVRGTFRRPRGLLLSIPERAVRVLPESERASWIQFGRLSTWADPAFKF